MLNLSLYNGIPTKKEIAINQFWNIVRDSKKKPFLYQKYLYLKKLETGSYKGYWGVFTQDKKPNKSEIGEDNFKFIWRVK